MITLFELTIIVVVQLLGWALVKTLIEDWKAKKESKPWKNKGKTIIK
jgi:hypothetical protein